MESFKVIALDIFKRVRGIKFSTKEKAVLCGFLFTILLSMTGFGSRCDSISNKVFRLHIVANSDSTGDQELKLKVRDKILKEHTSCFDYAQNLIDAKTITSDNLEDIMRTAKTEIINNGYDYDVEAEVRNMYFNTRQYSDVTLPAGNYEALRVTIGEGEGKNWWCVMFPPMCLPAAQERQELEDILTDDELEIVECDVQYEVRFKIVEIFIEIQQWFDESFDYLLDVCSGEHLLYLFGMHTAVVV